MIIRTLAAAIWLALSATAPMAQTAPSPNAPADPVRTAPPAPTPTPAPAAAATEMFVTGVTLNGQMRTSDLEEKSVYNLQNEKIGDVEDLLIDNEGRVTAVIVGVGGFLGLGKKDVAVAFKAFRVSREGNGDSKLTLDVAKATLQSAPEFKLAAN